MNSFPLTGNQFLWQQKYFDNHGSLVFSSLEASCWIVLGLILNVIQNSSWNKCWFPFYNTCFGLSRLLTLSNYLIELNQATISLVPLKGNQSFE